jgi:hypothetical protein
MRGLRCNLWLLVVLTGCRLRQFFFRNSRRTASDRSRYRQGFFYLKSLIPESNLVPAVADRCTGNDRTLCISPVVFLQPMPPP